MEWVLRVSQKNPEKMTGPDWSNFALEISVFSSLVNKNISRELRRQITAGANPRVSEDEAEGILWDFNYATRSILSHEVVRCGSITRGTNLLWDEKDGRFWLEPYSYSSWKDAAKESLLDLLVEFGHWVKICKAPMPHGGDDLCGEIFLARRPNQVYCSSNCQNRATTRTSRERQKTRTPKVKRKTPKSRRKS